ncbi:MAG: hypothetical protein FGF53_05460 [Candidatus Brockarchaeota archaeon]|nr:hypothetical protein [Candidatus Brockarchaeota archaeon]
MRIVIPVEDDRGLDSRLSEHFGRAPLFLMIELDEGGRVLKQETMRNEGEHFGGRAGLQTVYFSLSRMQSSYTVWDQGH